MNDGKISRRDFLCGTAAAALSVSLGNSLARASTPQKGRPNIVMIFADDLGYGDLGCYGSKTIRTPHIDALAAEGVRMTSGYVSAAVCSPSRAGLMTGRYQQRMGYEYNLSGSRDLGLPRDESTLANLLKGAGYATGMVGKWHLGFTLELSPLARGFDESFGTRGGGTLYATSRTPGIVTIADRKLPAERPRPVFRGNKKVREDAYITDAFTREAIDFIQRHKEEPFFLYLSYTAPHTPLQAKQADVDRNSHIQDPARRVYAAMVTAMDDGIGRIAKTLKGLDLEDDTMVVFFSDNGGVIWVAGDNGPLNGGKRYQYEGGNRVPFIVKWPGHLEKGATYQEPIISLDLYPTFAAVAGAQNNLGPQHDGVNLIPYLTGKIPGSPHDRLFWRSSPNRAIREGKWKLWQVNVAAPGSRDARARLIPRDQIPADSPHGQKILLFDLSRDLGEQVNVAQKHPEIVKRLIGALDEWESQLKTPMWPCTRSTIFERNGVPLQLFF